MHRKGVLSLFPVDWVISEVETSETKQVKSNTGNLGTSEKYKTEKSPIIPPPEVTNMLMVIKRENAFMCCDTEQLLIIKEQFGLFVAICIGALHFTVFVTGL